MKNNLTNALWRIYEAWERSGIENRAALPPATDGEMPPNEQAEAFEAYKKSHRSMDFDCFIKMHPDLLTELAQSIADENEQSITESLRNAIESSVKRIAQ